MSIETDSINTTKFEVTGSIDTTSSGQFEQKIWPLISKKTCNLELECSQLDYISSTGLRAFLRIAKLCASYNGSLFILSANQFVQETIQLSGLTHHFKFRK
tara:strand:- start:124 stop:426 length:303 start_codon:yes stop_codon:yes gene_type:complete